MVVFTASHASFRGSNGKSFFQSVRNDPFPFAPPCLANRWGSELKSAEGIGNHSLVERILLDFFFVKARHFIPGYPRHQIPRGRDFFLMMIL